MFFSSMNWQSGNLGTFSYVGFSEESRRLQPKRSYLPTKNGSKHALICLIIIPKNHGSQTPAKNTPKPFFFAGSRWFFHGFFQNRFLNESRIIIAIIYIPPKKWNPTNLGPSWVSSYWWVISYCYWHIGLMLNSLGMHLFDYHSPHWCVTWGWKVVGQLVPVKGVMGKMLGAPWDGGPLTNNPIYTLYSGYLLDISPFKGLLGGLNS